ncbi:MAG TPA: hypothetical protein DE045_01775 [Oceanospirillaceae bacterium]|nr:hypothetical protein [Oceanospirillaceae bacterium]
MKQPAHNLHGVGIGLRQAHVEHFLNGLPAINWLEVHSENYLQANSKRRHQLHLIRQNYAISCHGVGLSLGSTDPINHQHLGALKQLFDDIEPSLVSEHLSWSSVGGRYFNDLLPLPYTHESLQHMISRVNQTQDLLQRQLLIENPSSYLAFNNPDMSEAELLNQLSQHTGCKLLLDLNNVFVSCSNMKTSTEAYLAAIHWPNVAEVHLAGHTIKHLAQGDIRIDTHNSPVCEQVWQMVRDYRHELQLIPTLIEWDADLPPLDILLTEAVKAERNIGLQGVMPLGTGY